MGARIIGFLILFACVNPVFTQIRGTVIDSKTSEPIFGVHINSGKAFVITDKNGDFELNNEASIIVFSHVAYQTDTLTTNQISNKNVVKLSPIAYEFEQLIIRGNLNAYPIMEMPSNVGVIQNLGKTISNGISYVESLSMVPGVFAHIGSLNTNRIIVRGIGSRTPYGTNRIKAYYKDIPLTTGDGTTEIEDLNVLDIGSVEVLKGSKSALYGSGLGGVIRFNEPDYISGTNVLVKSNVASYNTYKTDLGVHLRKEAFYFRTNISNAQTDGWRQNSQYKMLNFMLNSGFKTNRNQLDLLFLAIKAKANIASSINQEMFNNSPESAASNWNSVKGYEKYNKIIAGVSFNHSFTEKLSNKISLFVQSYSGYESRPFNIMDDNSAKLGVRNITTYKWKEIKIQAGIESLFEKYNWDIYETMRGEQGDMKSEFSETRQPNSIFLNSQFKIRNLISVEAGISLNTLKYKLKDKFEDDQDLSGTYKYDIVYSPFVGINLPVNKSVRIYSSVSSGFSAPSVEETLLPRGAINPNLKPETGLNTELGIRFQDEKKRVFIDACIYSIWISNLLVTKRETEEIFYGANAGKIWHRGVELSSTIGLNNPNSRFPISINFSYSGTNATFTKYIDDGTDYSDNKLPGIPDQNIFILANIESPWGFYFTPNFQFTGKQYMDDSNSKIADSYKVLHLKAGFSKKMKLFDVDFAFGVRNILDEHYASMILVNAPSFGGASPRYYYPGMPRNYFCSLSLSF
jgi:iron complex outermembrane receptor protein